jgi:hypothetical protein
MLPVPDWQLPDTGLGLGFDGESMKIAALTPLASVEKLEPDIVKLQKL